MTNTRSHSLCEPYSDTSGVRFASDGEGLSGLALGALVDERARSCIPTRPSRSCRKTGRCRLSDISVRPRNMGASESDEAGSGAQVRPQVIVSMSWHEAQTGEKAEEGILQASVWSTHGFIRCAQFNAKQLRRIKVNLFAARYLYILYAHTVPPQTMQLLAVLKHSRKAAMGVEHEDRTDALVSLCFTQCLKLRCFSACFLFPLFFLRSANVCLSFSACSCFAFLFFCFFAFSLLGSPNERGLRHVINRIAKGEGML